MPKYTTLINKLFLINKIIQQRDIASILKMNIIQLRFHKILSIDNLEILNFTFEYISKVTHFHHIELNGNPYYETDNMWSTYAIKKRPSYDENILCKAYLKCDRKPIIYPNTHDKIKYILRYYYGQGECDSEVDEPQYVEFVSQISPYKLKNILLIGFNNLTVINKCGENKDHRGSNHCNVFLPMHNNVNMKKYATLYDLAIAYYKLKSHKWDNNYEMFCGVNTRMRKGSGNAKVFFTFDHGS